MQAFHIGALGGARGLQRRGPGLERQLGGLEPRPLEGYGPVRGWQRSIGAGAEGGPALQAGLLEGEFRQIHLAVEGRFHIPDGDGITAVQVHLQRSQEQLPRLQVQTILREPGVQDDGTLMFAGIVQIGRASCRERV